MRQIANIPLISKNNFLKSLIGWAKDKDCFCFMGENVNAYKFSDYTGFKVIAGIGKINELKPNANSINSFNLIDCFINDKTVDIMGFLSYDLKNHTEKLNSENHDNVEMPLFHFFQPEFIFDFSGFDEVKVEYSSDRITEQQVVDLCKTIECELFENKLNKNQTVIPSARVSKNEYIENIRKIKEHIQLGDVYELNYCIEFYAENIELNSAEVYMKLNRISPAPFSCFYKVDNKYLICASPERFLKKEKNKIIAQPMKGTARRSSDVAVDMSMKEQLSASEKERAENVMIVDLVRNDLSKTAIKESVKVDELFGIYSFPQVHQMVSTVSSEMRDDVSAIDVIKSAFPMGSMTGAPKVKAMELIEEYEITKRGLFSGSVGYITKEMNFDFNVVIRSIQYNADKKYLSFMVGSAITIDSDPEKEYEECLLKAQALIEALK